MGYAVLSSKLEYISKRNKTLFRNEKGKIMGFQLGSRSIAKLEGVDERMQAVVRSAIQIPKQPVSAPIHTDTRPD